MKVLKRSLCIFLSVVVLFFSVNNSYFSPHKMDTVEASSIVVGGTVITAELLIQVIAALAVAGLAVGVIVEWSDMDMEAVLEDFHSWLQENTTVLDSLNIDGTSALKEWAASDTWVVIEGGGGSAPSPSPDNDENTEASTHGGESLWPAGTTWTMGNLIAAGGLLAEQVYNQSVAMDSGVNAVAQAYMQSKINTFGTVNAGTDAITQALFGRYGEIMENPDFHYLGGMLRDADGKQIINMWVGAPLYDGYYSMAVNDTYVALLNNSKLVFYKNVNGVATKLSSWRFDTIYTVSKQEATLGEITHISSSKSTYVSWGSDRSINIPIFESVEAIQSFYDTGDDSACINRERANNYIDTSDDYGWASTANISPNDLAAVMPDVAGNLNGRAVSLSGVMAAINALKSQLEENNPNTGSDVAVPYPNVDDYVATATTVVTDIEIFPRADDIADTDPVPDVDDVVDPAPDTDTMKDYSGLLGLIIGILQNILQAIKDLLGWFIIDFPAIKAHILTALDDVPALTGYEDFLALVDSAKAQITDSYEYPVITIECPEILLPYWKQEQIILLDFEDYATYFIWVRTAMAFAILFGFAVWCVRDIKVSFTLN